MPIDPSRRAEIILSLGRILTSRPLPVSPESELPFAKSLIRQAIFEEMIEASDDERRRNLEQMFVSLESFLEHDEYQFVERYQTAIRECEASASKGDWARVNTLRAALEKDRTTYEAIEKRILARYQQQAELLHRKLSDHTRQPTPRIPSAPHIHCAQCSKQIAVGSTFCYYCGAKQPLWHGATACPACGSALPAGARECANCLVEREFGGARSTVVNYRDDETHCFSQLRLPDGSRILVSIGDGQIVVYELAMWGTIPSGVVWRASDPDDIHGLFRTDADFQEKPLRLLVDRLLPCRTIVEVRYELQRLRRG